MRATEQWRRLSVQVAAPVAGLGAGGVGRSVGDWAGTLQRVRESVRGQWARQKERVRLRKKVKQDYREARGRN